MIAISLIFISFATFTLSLEQEYPASVNLTLFYETQCVYSKDFIQNQLHATYKILSDYINLELMPYGKASQSKHHGNWEFTCQHGNEECFGNKVHTCVISKSVNSQKKILDFISCTIDANYTKSELENCATQYGVNFNRLEMCYTTKEGDNLLAKMGRRTHHTRPRVKYVPMLFFDGVFDQHINENALEDLLGTVCKMLRKKRTTSIPKPCIQWEESHTDWILNSL